ncbi:PadR family transcriptional regulator [Actinomadura rupiterrae]|uniref:PadR family transcriptional regulator n=1 Tax=Actinomadura rupiterrae TaxID=559627 RepID=UPI0020A4078C|nr:PadR family transcriptional regulator [Actinomadura rupiterrae]MCP2335634.1 DNA-binding PadR family transcriptional regulator [Actinomadura rupiterrae]
MAHADEPPAEVRLPATAWAVLGILAFGEELTGYEVRQWAEHILRFFYWSPAMSQIYSELKRLEQVGYAASREVSGEDGRPRRVYAITDAGRAAASDWLAHAPVEPPALKHGPLLRVWLGHLADPDRLREVVTQHRDRSADLAAEADEARRAAAAVSGWAYPELVARWAVRYHTAERDLAARLLDDLDELVASGRAPDL